MVDTFINTTSSSGAAASNSSLQGLGVVHHDAHNQLHQLHPHSHEEESGQLSPMLAILLIYGILFMMIGAQAGLFLWRQRHKKSYELVTLVGLWLMPPLFCIQLKFVRFILVWLAYSAITGYLLSLCMVKKLEHTTPRKVYTWFLVAHRVSVGVGVAGYGLLLSELFGLGPVWRMVLPKDAAMDLVWYGLYFGVLGRDCAEVASDRMAASMGNMGRRLMNTANNCGICGNEMQDFTHLGEADTGAEKCVQLSCKHCFHDLCIRGWTMVGKKEVCPVCMEKVDLRALYADRPWETRNLTWVQMLDSVRYLVVWNPLIFMVLSFVAHFIGPRHHHHHDAAHAILNSTTAATLLPSAHGLEASAATGQHVLTPSLVGTVH